MRAYLQKQQCGSINIYGILLFESVFSLFFSLKISELGSCYLTKASLKLMNFFSPSVRMTGAHHCAWLHFES
jgi:hypothetical protein